MATYQKDITKDINPAQADTGTLARGIITSGQYTADAIKMSGKATAETISAVGGTIWDMYKGVQEGNLERGLQGEVDKLQADITAVKSADETAKLKVEQERSSFGAMAEEMRAASILAGADPTEARNLSTGFYQEKENASLAAFRTEQQRIIAARDSLPGRQKEMMLRSETLLKNAIANMPGMANNFRKIATEVTGKEHLDLYSVNRLYEDVAFIEKQKIEQDKKQALIEKQNQDAYVADRTSTGGVGQVQALSEYASLNKNEKNDLAVATVAANFSTKQSKEALEKGGNAIVNAVTFTKTGFENSMLTANANIYTQMQKLGVTRAMITTGSIPDSILRSPEYKKLVEDAGTKTLTLLDAQYQQLNETIIAAGKNNPVDSAKYSQASSDAKAWYDSSRKYYTENKTTFLHALADPDFTKTAQQRLTLIDTFVKSLGLSDAVIASLGMSGNPAAKSEAQARYPKESAMINYANNLRRSAMNGIGQEDWQTLVKKMDGYASGDRTIPTTIVEATASLMNFTKDADLLRKQVVSDTYSPTVATDISKVISGAVALPANAERYLKETATATDTALTKVPASEKSALTNVINQSVNESLYGFRGHADIAKERLDVYNSSYKGGQQVTTTFADLSGNQPLKLVATRVTVPAGFAETSGGAAVGSPRLTGQFAASAVTPPKEVNNALSGVDDVLRIQARTTGQPIEKLRAEFIKNFNQEGAPSATFTSGLTGPTAGEAKNKAAQEADKIDPGATSGFGTRNDGTTKGTGFLGVLKSSDGRDVTEYAINSEDVVVGGKNIEFPTIVPTLTAEEKELMLNDIIPNNKRIPNSIYDKAVAHAKDRLAKGKSVFADNTPAPVAAPAAKEEVSLNNDFETYLTEMKKVDPDTNEDFLRRAFNNATPEKKKELAAKIKEARVRMSDISNTAG